MSRRRKPKAEPLQLAKVIPFQGWRSSLEHDDGAIETAARKTWLEADNLSKVTKPTDTQEKIEAFQAAVQRALKSNLEMRALFEDQLGGRFPITAQNAKWTTYFANRISNLTKWADWCEEQLERFAPDATVYNLAEFRRFRNRVTRREVQKEKADG